MQPEINPILPSESQIVSEAYHSSFVPAELPYDFVRHTEAGNENESEPPQKITEQTIFGLIILATSLFAGVAGNLLLRSIPWGINFGIWITLIVVATLAITQIKKHHLNKNFLWLSVPAIFFAATFSWRDSSTLNALSLLALLLIALITGLQTRHGNWLVANVTDYLKNFLVGVAQIIAGPIFLLSGEIKWKEIPYDGWSKKVLAIVRGLILAIPLLIIFGALLAAADAAFQRIIAKIFNIDEASVISHLFFTGLFTWLVAGFIRWIFTPSEIPATASVRKSSVSLGIIETGTVLGLLDGLFLSFVLVQFKYFFGGKANLATGRGFEYAEYARHGFFELVWVSVLVLPLLLGAHWLLKKENPAHEKIFRLLAGIKIALLFVIMISAMQRMRLYQRECGLTELRVYTMAFMIWLAIVFVWFAATVLRGHRERFAFGAVVSGLIMIAALHFINPDELIVRVNLQRAIEGKVFDANYTSSLSADAVPILVKGMSNLKDEDKNLVSENLKNIQSVINTSDWRSWNWSRHKAKQSSSTH